MEGKLKLSIQSKIALAKINKTRGVTYNHLKPLQYKSIEACLQGDSMILLPTGYGKSLIMEMVMNINQENETRKCIIISPLTVIIEEQCIRLQDKAIHVDRVLQENLKTGT